MVARFVALAAGIATQTIPSMILVAQRGHGPINARLIALLYGSGHRVLVASSISETAEIMDRVDVDAVLICDPEVAQRCRSTFCRHILDTIESPPPLLGLARIDDPEQRARCQECMELMDPEAPTAAIASRVTALAG